ncbi:hypothetical protein ACVW00_002908 [Marmoricola sp. URHA0025 HA25]
MNVFTRHRTGASRSTVTSRMRNHRDQRPFLIPGTRLSV